MLPSVSTFFKVEKDILYIIGYSEGFKEGLAEAAEEAMAKRDRRWVISVIEKLDLSDEQAADIVNVPIAFVQEVRESLKK